MSWTNAQRKYSNSAKGRASRQKYQSSEKGKLSRQKYLAKRRAKLAGKEQVEAITPVEIKEEASKMEKEVAKK